MTPTHAYEVLDKCKAFGDYHQLTSATVDALLVEATRLRYRKPKNANGSRGRYFHAFLMRAASSLTGQAREMIEGKNSTVTVKRRKRSVTISNP